MKGNVILSVDIGTTKISGIVFYIGGNGTPRIRGAMSRPVILEQDDKIINPGSLVSKITSFIKNIEKEYNVKVSDAIVSVSTLHCEVYSVEGAFTRRNPASPISRWEMMEMINEVKSRNEYPDKEIIHVIPQVFSVDGNITGKNPVGISGKSVEFNLKIVAVNKLLASQIRSIFERININIEGLYCDGVVVPHGVLLNEEMNSRTLLIDIGGETTNWTFIENGIIRDTGGINMGGNIITADIRDVLGIPWNYAEKIKRQVGSAYSKTVKEHEVVTLVIPSLLPRELSRKKICEMIEARTRELFDVLFTCIEQRFPNWHKSVKRIAMTGGGSLLRHISCVCEEMSGMETYLVFPTSNLPPLDDDNMVTTIVNPEYVVCLGQIWVYVKDLYTPHTSSSSVFQKMLSFLNTAILEN